MIHIQHLEFRYPQSEFALQVDGLDIESGQKVAIIGLCLPKSPSGTDLKTN
jgi:ABC-type transport system involved in cytochrome bd biosynthesis fused ATPase/permease subunit